MKARLQLEQTSLTVDLARAVSLAIELDPAAPQPRHFGAPRATLRPWSAPGFSGSVAAGASCNCGSLTLVPHCNGTHTEGVGHLTTDRVEAHRIVPAGLLPAVVRSVQIVEAAATREGATPSPQPGDRLVTREQLEPAWRAALPFAPRMLVIRTLPNDDGKRTRDYTDANAPYLTNEAARMLVERGIEHLIVDLPSVDRSHDEGRLSAHRIFFGLPAGSTSSSEATRPRATITELAFIPDALPDGPYLAEIQAPAIAGDAVPSRPLLYPLLAS